jgi:hypothetical protein
MALGRHELKKLTYNLCAIGKTFYQRCKLSQDFVFIKLLRIVDLPIFIVRLFDKTFKQIQYIFNNLCHNFIDQAFYPRILN